MRDMKLKGAQIVVEALKKQGVKDIFGIPGGAVLPLFDALYDSDLNFYLTRHEQAAAHAADGYARSTGKVGVCIATSGPGATNLVTGIATAYMDSVPIVAITGQVKTFLIGNDAFQEADTTGITRPITKYNYLVKDVKDLARTIYEAFYIASTGRPGPVLIDLPVDIEIQETEFKSQDRPPHIRGYSPKVKGHPLQIKKAAEMIKKSKRPVIYAGGGVIISSASSELRKLAEKCKIPVTTTLMGLGAFPQTHPLSLEMLGMHGTVYANLAIQNSDLIIAVGARFDDRVTGKISAFAPQAKIIHVDIDPSAISKNVVVDIPIVGDAREVLRELLKIVEPPEVEEWLKQIKKWKKEFPLKYKNNGRLKPQYVVQKIYEVTEGKAIITTEVGQNQMWAAHWYKFTKPRTFITSGGLGTMGYGFPAAIGAKVGNPDAVVIDIAGDGSIQMNIQELATAVAHEIPVIVAILNNQYLGMVRQWQQLFYKERYSYTYLKNPDFVKVAEAFGAIGIRVTKKSEVETALKKALRSRKKPVVIDFIVDEFENVYPMVPAGEAIDRMIGGMA